MDLLVIVGGLLLLVLVSVAIGLDDRGARRRAWGRIDCERRDIWAERQRAMDLLDSAELCRDCPCRPR
jgi:hypothetical protein